MDNLLKKISKDKTETKSKKKIENLIFLIIILIITYLALKNIWTDNKEDVKEENQNTSIGKILSNNSIENSKDELEQKLENILSTIKNVGDVKVFINYKESSNIMPLYDETTTTSNTEEGDSSGGTRNVTQTETQKEIVFSQNSGETEAIIQKTTMPVIEGAIVTADGAADATIKTNIIKAVEAVTGLSIDKIQVFEKER